MPARTSQKTAENRLKRCLEAFPKALEKFESDHPEWRYEVLYWLLERALKSLRGYLDSNSETEITWKSPYVEIQFPVDCKWSENSAAQEPNFTLQAGRLSIAEMVDDESAAKALSQLVIRHIEIVALQDWTNQSAFEQHGDQLQPILGVAQIEALNKIDDPAERKEAGNALFWPRSFGAGTVDYGEIKEGQAISKSSAKQIAAIAPPLVYLPLDLDGHKIRLITILEIKPLVANVDTKRAYFPIVVGLAIQADEGETPDERWFEHPWASLHKWEEADRQAIWEVLPLLIESTLAAFGSKSPPEMEEAILSVNAKVKVTVPKGDRAETQRAVANIVANLQATGEVVKLEISSSEKQLLDPALRRRLSTLLKSLCSNGSSNVKGKSLEDLVIALFESIADFRVISRVKTQTEEIDLWITNNADVGPFRREGSVILVECKNWSGRCGKNEFASLLSKMMNRGDQCTLGFLISWNGFAKTVGKEMLRASRGPFRIVPLDGDWLREVVESGDFRAKLTEAREKAMMV